MKGRLAWASFFTEAGAGVGGGQDGDVGPDRGVSLGPASTPPVSLPPHNTSTNPHSHTTI